MSTSKSIAEDYFIDETCEGIIHRMDDENSATLKFATKNEKTMLNEFALSTIEMLCNGPMQKRMESVFGTNLEKLINTNTKFALQYKMSVVEPDDEPNNGLGILCKDNTDYFDMSLTFITDSDTVRQLYNGRVDSENCVGALPNDGTPLDEAHNQSAPPIADEISQPGSAVGAINDNSVALGSLYISYDNSPNANEILVLINEIANSEGYSIDISQIADIFKTQTKLFINIFKKFIHCAIDETFIMDANVRYSIVGYLYDLCELDTLCEQLKTLSNCKVSEYFRYVITINKTNFQHYYLREMEKAQKRHSAQPDGEGEQTAELNEDVLMDDAANTTETQHDADAEADAEADADADADDTVDDIYPRLKFMRI